MSGWDCSASIGEFIPAYQTNSQNYLRESNEAKVCHPRREEGVEQKWGFTPW